MVGQLGERLSLVRIGKIFKGTGDVFTQDFGLPSQCSFFARWTTRASFLTSCRELEFDCRLGAWKAVGVRRKL